MNLVDLIGQMITLFNLMAWTVAPAVKQSGYTNALLLIRYCFLVAAHTQRPVWRIVIKLFVGNVYLPLMEGISDVGPRFQDRGIYFLLSQ